MKNSNKMKGQRGSVTLFVLVVCLFMIIVLLLVNIGIMNKNASQEKEIVQIGRNYAVGENELANSYAKIADENGYPNYSEVQKMIEEAVKKAKDETRTELEQNIDEAIKTAKIGAKLEAFPVGSIYMSTSPTNPSSYIGGTWESYGQGRTLVGAGTGTDSNNTSQLFKVGATGGEYTYKLAIEQLPGHNHTITPEGSIISTFTGSKVDTSTTGSHTHSFSAGGRALVVESTTSHKLMAKTQGYSPQTGAAWFVDMNKNVSAIANGGNHTHTVTAEGTVTSTFSGTSGTTSSVGSGIAINQLQPYIVTYMWKRIS